VAGAPKCGAREKAGHSGRDDRKRNARGARLIVPYEGGPKRAGSFGRTQGKQAPPLQRGEDQLLKSDLDSSLASMGSRKGLLASGAPAMASFISLEADA